jgi:hypothetical protein
MKYDRYTKQDKEGKTQGYGFDYLLEADVLLESVSNINCKTSQNNIEWAIQKDGLLPNNEK